MKNQDKTDIKTTKKRFQRLISKQISFFLTQLISLSFYFVFQYAQSIKNFSYFIFNHFLVQILLIIKELYHFFYITLQIKNRRNSIDNMDNNFTLIKPVSLKSSIQVLSQQQTQEIVSLFHNVKSKRINKQIQDQFQNLKQGNKKMNQELKDFIVNVQKQAQKLQKLIKGTERKAKFGLFFIYTQQRGEELKNFQEQITDNQHLWSSYNEASQLQKKLSKNFKEPQNNQRNNANLAIVHQPQNKENSQQIIQKLQVTFLKQYKTMEKYNKNKQVKGGVDILQTQNQLNLNEQSLQFIRQFTRYSYQILYPLTVFLNSQEHNKTIKELSQFSQKAERVQQNIKKQILDEFGLSNNSIQVYMMMKTTQFQQKRYEMEQFEKNLVRQEANEEQKEDLQIIRNQQDQIREKKKKIEYVINLCAQARLQCTTQEAQNYVSTEESQQLVSLFQKVKKINKKIQDQFSKQQGNKQRNQKLKDLIENGQKQAQKLQQLIKDTENKANEGELNAIKALAGLKQVLKLQSLSNEQKIERLNKLIYALNDKVKLKLISKRNFKAVTEVFYLSLNQIKNIYLFMPEKVQIQIQQNGIIAYLSQMYFNLKQYLKIMKQEIMEITDEKLCHYEKYITNFLKDAINKLTQLQISFQDIKIKKILESFDQQNLIQTQLAKIYRLLLDFIIKAEEKVQKIIQKLIEISQILIDLFKISNIKRGLIQDQKEKQFLFKCLLKKINDLVNVLQI